MSVDVERIYDYSLGIKMASSCGGRRARRSAFCYEVSASFGRHRPKRRGMKENAAGRRGREKERERERDRERRGRKTAETRRDRR